MGFRMTFFLLCGQQRHTFNSVWWCQRSGNAQWVNKTRGPGNKKNSQREAQEEKQIEVTVRRSKVVHPQNDQPVNVTNIHLHLKLHLCSRLIGRWGRQKKPRVHGWCSCRAFLQAEMLIGHLHFPPWPLGLCNRQEGRLPYENTARLWTITSEQPEATEHIQLATTGSESYVSRY